MPVNVDWLGMPQQQSSRVREVNAETTRRVILTRAHTLHRSHAWQLFHRITHGRSFPACSLLHQGRLHLVSSLTFWAAQLTLGLTIGSVHSCRVVHSIFANIRISTRSIKQKSPVPDPVRYSTRSFQSVTVADCLPTQLHATAS